MSESDINRVWPEWQVEGVLGSGAFGTVYLIRRTVDDNTVFAAAKVIKVPPADEAVENAEKLGISRDLLSTYFGKFKNDLNWELTMFRTVSSQHLAVIDDLEVEDASGGPGWFGYIRTGLYTPLSVYFEKSPSTQEDAARLGSELCQALDACGEYSMVHGEIKPENVMVTDAGGFVLTDFGVRRCLEKAGTGIFGAMESDYEAPELGEDRKYTPAADIYSLGMVMCYTANGGTLPENRSPDMIKDIDKGLAAVIKKATAADPAERYQSAAEMRAAIARLPLGKKSPRRAMAAAAAFDAVKRNGGAIRPAT
ncbi:MAG: protein kinase, partial [Oscillospiraceae bacterium]